MCENSYGSRVADSAVARMVVYLPTLPDFPGVSRICYITPILPENWAVKTKLRFVGDFSLEFYHNYLCAAFNNQRTTKKCVHVAHLENTAYASLH